MATTLNTTYDSRAVIADVNALAAKLTAAGRGDIVAKAMDDMTLNWDDLYNLFVVLDAN